MLKPITLIGGAYYEKKVLSLFLAVASIGMFSTSASATDELSGNTSVISEMEAILEIRQMSDIELEEAGYSQEDIQAVRNFDLERAVLERAQLPEETLKIYGYTDEQIKILKSYDGSPITSRSPVLAASSECTGYFYSATCTPYSITGRFTWTWQIVPIYKYSDSVVFCWNAINSSGLKIDATGSGYVTLRYYNLSTGAADASKNQTISGVYSSIKNSVSVFLPMTYDGSDNQYWAKSGTFFVTISSSNPMSYVNVGCGYGHATLSLGDITYSVDNNLNVSFSSSIVGVIVDQFNYTGKITSSGAVTNYGTV